MSISSGVFAVVIIAAAIVFLLVLAARYARNQAVARQAASLNATALEGGTYRPRAAYGQPNAWAQQRTGNFAAGAAAAVASRREGVNRQPEERREGEQLPSYQDAGKDTVLPVFAVPAGAPPTEETARPEEGGVRRPAPVVLRARGAPPEYEIAAGAV